MSIELSTRHIPLALGAATLVVGIALRLWPSPTPAPIAAPPAASESASAGEDAGSDEPPPVDEDYAPDLSGPTIGELVVAGASMAHGIAVVDGRLTWLLTDGATVGSSRKDGGDAVVVFASSDPDAFGGTMASSNDTLWWSVDREGDEPESIYRASGAELRSKLVRPEAVASGTSPDHLDFSPSGLIWSDLGVVWRLDGASPNKLATRQQRIVTLAGGAAAVSWIEAPYEGAGAQQLVTLATGQAEPRVRSQLAANERDFLVDLGGTLVWAESSDTSQTLWALDARAAAPRRLATTGVVTSLTHDGERIYWAEAFGDEDAPTSLLRFLDVGREVPAQRLGPVQGHVTALVVDDGQLFWSSAQGIERFLLPR